MEMGMEMDMEEEKVKEAPRRSTRASQKKAEKEANKGNHEYTRTLPEEVICWPHVFVYLHFCIVFCCANKIKLGTDPVVEEKGAMRRGKSGKDEASDDEDDGEKEPPRRRGMDDDDEEKTKAVPRAPSSSSKKSKKKRQDRDYIKRRKKPKTQTFEYKSVRIILGNTQQVEVKWMTEVKTFEPLDNFKGLNLAEGESLDENGQSPWFRKVITKSAAGDNRKEDGWHDAPAGGLGNSALDNPVREAPPGLGPQLEDLVPFQATDSYCATNAVSLALPGLMLSEDSSEYKVLRHKLNSHCDFADVKNIQDVPFPTMAVQAKQVKKTKLVGLGQTVGSFVALSNAHCVAIIREEGSTSATLYETDPRWPDPIKFRHLSTVFSKLPHINGFGDAYEVTSEPILTKKKQGKRKRKLDALMATITEQEKQNKNKKQRL
jgi:hypothetical protein